MPAPAKNIFSLFEIDFIILSLKFIFDVITIIADKPITKLIKFLKIK